MAKWTKNRRKAMLVEVPSRISTLTMPIYSCANTIRGQRKYRVCNIVNDGWLVLVVWAHARPVLYSGSLTLSRWLSKTHQIRKNSMKRCKRIIHNGLFDYFVRWGWIQRNLGSTLYISSPHFSVLNRTHLSSLILSFNTFAFGKVVSLSQYKQTHTCS